MSDLEALSNLKNFNLLKYTDHYVLTIDPGMGKPIIFEGDYLEEVLEALSLYRESLA